MPSSVVLLCHYLNDEAHLKTDGIFRLSAQKSEVSALAARIDAGDIAVLDSASHDTHVLANALTLWLRKLPEPLLSMRSHTALIEASRALERNSERGPTMVRRALCMHLSASHRATMQFVVQFFRRVAQFAQFNRMDAKNCAIVLGPCVLRDAEHGALADNDEAMMVAKMQAGNTVVEHLLNAPDLDFYFKKQ